MSCPSLPSTSRMQAVPGGMMTSDAFGAGCTQGCGYPQDLR